MQIANSQRLMYLSYPIVYYYLVVEIREVEKERETEMKCHQVTTYFPKWFLEENTNKFSANEYIYFCVSHTEWWLTLVEIIVWGQLSDDDFGKQFRTIKQKQDKSAIWTLNSGTMDTTNLFIGIGLCVFVWSMTLFTKCFSHKLNHFEFAWIHRA